MGVILHNEEYMRKIERERLLAIIALPVICAGFLILSIAGAVDGFLTRDWVECAVGVAMFFLAVACTRSTFERDDR